MTKLTRSEIARRWKEKNPDFYINWHLQKNFGISVEQYREMSARQNDVCAICKRPETMKNRSLAVDHCHKTGRIRGLLCGGCNVSLGRVNDDPALLQSMIDYLRADDVIDQEEREDDR